MTFKHIDTKLKFPDLECLTLPTGRVYTTKQGKQYPSITTVLSLLSRDGIAKWKEKEGKEKANKIAKRASERGERIHTIAENYLNNDINWKKSQDPFDLDMFKSMRTEIDGKIDNIWAQEVALYSDKLKIAGRVDVIAEHENDLSIIDFKTSAKPKKKEYIKGYELQCDFYAAAFQEMFGIPIKKCVILIGVDYEMPQVFTTKPSVRRLKEILKLREQYRIEKGI